MKYQPLFGGKANWHLDGIRVNTGQGGTWTVVPLKPCEEPFHTLGRGGLGLRCRPWQGVGEKSIFP